MKATAGKKISQRDMRAVGVCLIFAHHGELDADILRELGIDSTFLRFVDSELQDSNLDRKAQGVQHLAQIADQVLQRNAVSRFGAHATTH